MTSVAVDRVYLIIYAATNLGAFAVVIAVSRKTRSGEISSFGGLFGYAPGLTVLMTIFLASLAGIPPLGGWYAKFGVFKAILGNGTFSGAALPRGGGRELGDRFFTPTSSASCSWKTHRTATSPRSRPVGSTWWRSASPGSTLIIGFAPGPSAAGRACHVALRR